MAQALFANQRETNLASTIVLVEEVLGELGYQPPETRRIELEGAVQAWRIQKGSAIATVAMIARPDFTHIRVSSVVMTLDAKIDRFALFTHLLELNHALCGNAFTLLGDRVVLVAERTTLDLDRSEIVDIVRRVTTNADAYDNELVAKYGGTLGGAD
jgi:site-specific recombinase